MEHRPRVTLAGRHRSAYGTYGELSRAFREAGGGQLRSLAVSDALLRDRAIDKYERILEHRVMNEQKLQRQQYPDGTHRRSLAEANARRTERRPGPTVEAMESRKGGHRTAMGRCH